MQSKKKLGERNKVMPYIWRFVQIIGVWRYLVTPLWNSRKRVNANIDQAFILKALQNDSHVQELFTYFKYEIRKWYGYNKLCHAMRAFQIPTVIIIVELILDQTEKDCLRTKVSLTKF